MSEQEKFEKLQQKIEELKKSGTYDLSMEEDLSLAIMNLVSLEEHFFFTAQKTGKDEYFDFLDEVRQMRKKLLARMVQKHEGETWCITKHLLAATMRVMEVGTKLLGEGKKAEAKVTFALSYKIYALFWAVRLKLVDLSKVKKVSGKQINIHDESGTQKPWKMEDILNKLVNCCDE